MVGKAEGSGAAFNATVLIENNVAALEDALVAAREYEKGQFFVHQVERMQTKVKKYEGHLADAKTALENAQVELREYEAAQAELKAKEASQKDGDQ